MEISIFKYYVIHAVHTNKSDKVHEFFEKLTPEYKKIQIGKTVLVSFNQKLFGIKKIDSIFFSALPYLKNVEDNPNFTMYFTRITEFLSVVFQV